MKTSVFVFSWLNSLMLAVAIVILAAVSTAKGKNNINANAGVPSIPSNVINGLFTPTQADRFFQTGRENFAKEIKTFNHPQLYLGDELLQFDPELIKQMQRHHPAHNFQFDHTQYELNDEAVSY